MFGGIAMHFVSYKPLLLWGALIAAVYVFAFSAYTQRGPRAQGFVLIMLMYGCMYGYGFVTVADTLLDHAPATTFATSVVGEHEVHGRSTTYYLDLAAWGPFDGTNKLSVPHANICRHRLARLFAWRFTRAIFTLSGTRALNAAIALSWGRRSKLLGAHRKLPR